MAFASELLSLYPGGTVVPEPGPFVPNKTPSDVYGRLRSTMTKVFEIVGLLGGSNLQILFYESGDILPSDVYDIASLIRGELKLMHSSAGLGTAPLPVYPGSKLPAHVFQRAGMLDTQLTDLLEHVREKPNSLRAAKRN